MGQPTMGGGVLEDLTLMLRGGRYARWSISVPYVPRPRWDEIIREPMTEGDVLVMDRQK